jgi:hypothetical protein
MTDDDRRRAGPGHRDAAGYDIPEGELIDPEAAKFTEDDFNRAVDEWAFGSIADPQDDLARLRAIEAAARELLRAAFVGEEYWTANGIPMKAPHNVERKVRALRAALEPKP